MTHGTNIPEIDADGDGVWSAEMCRISEFPAQMRGH
jgi:hypothetical protein